MHSDGDVGRCCTGDSSAVRSNSLQVNTMINSTQHNPLKGVRVALLYFQMKAFSFSCFPAHRYSWEGIAV